jgi:hypothetical protein
VCRTGCGSVKPKGSQQAMSKGTDNLALVLLTGELPESSRTSDYILNCFRGLSCSPASLSVHGRQRSPAPLSVHLHCPSTAISHASVPIGPGPCYTAPPGRVIWLIRDKQATRKAREAERAYKQAPGDFLKQRLNRSLHAQSAAIRLAQTKAWRSTLQKATSDPSILWKLERWARTKSFLPPEPPNCHHYAEAQVSQILQLTARSRGSCS